MNIAIIGASGFIGTAVTQALLQQADHHLTLFSHSASALQFASPHGKRIRSVDGTVLKPADINDALQGCDYAVYLVHLMGQSGHFADDEKRAAHTFGKAVRARGIKRVVYVGGMGQADTDIPLTPHLASRQQTGEIVRSYAPQLIELRTPMVIGDGGAGYEILKTIVDHSPVLPMPRWARSETQPITVTDVARYVVAALKMPETNHVSVAIGGPERMSYATVAKRYAVTRKRHLYVMPIPLPKWLVVWGLRNFKRSTAAITVADMLASAGYSTRQDDAARELFGEVVPEPIERSM